MLKVAIVDDDTYNFDKITSLLSAYPQFTPTFFNNPLRFIEKIKSTHFNLILLDIEMPEMNGLDILNALQKIQYDCLIIFITNNEQYMINCFDKNVIGFVSKSSLNYQLIPCMDKAVALLSPDTIKLDTKHKTIEVIESNIVVCELIMRKIYITLSNCKKIQLKYKALSEVSCLLSSDLFYQINRSTLVNLNKISNFQGYDIYMAGFNLPFTLSRYRKSDFMDIYFNYVLRRN